METQLKCQKHGVSFSELESAFDKTLYFFPDLKHSQVEERYIMLGVTDEGRHVFAVFMLRKIGEKTFAQSVHVTCTKKRLMIMKQQLPELKTDGDAEDSGVVILDQLHYKIEMIACSDNVIHYL